MWVLPHDNVAWSVDVMSDMMSECFDMVDRPLALSWELIG